jgi:hypothetical protein
MKEEKISVEIYNSDVFDYDSEELKDLLEKEKIKFETVNSGQKFVFKIGAKKIQHLDFYFDADFHFIRSKITSIVFYRQFEREELGSSMYYGIKGKLDLDYTDTQKESDGITYICANGTIHLLLAKKGSDYYLKLSYVRSLTGYSDYVEKTYSENTSNIQNAKGKIMCNDKNINKSCFVIQPFDDNIFDKRYNDIFAPAIEAANLEPYRVDKDPKVRKPIDEIESGISNSRLCFAEITTNNPNVGYELGFAFARKKDVVMVCSNEREGGFPFDIQHRKIINYKTSSSSDFDSLKKDITLQIEAFLKNPD